MSLPALAGVNVPTSSLAVRLDSKLHPSNNHFKDLKRTMAECGPRKKKYMRFPVGAFMAKHEEKREEAVRQSEKIMAENLKIAKKEKELRAKRKKLECLETKVIFDCVIGKLIVHRNYWCYSNSFISRTVKD